MRRVPLIGLTGAAAFLAAFFLIFNYLFSDGPTGLGHPERLVTYLIVFVAYGLVAAPGARWGGGRRWMWATLSAGPGVVLALAYSVSEPGIAAFAVIYSGLAVAGASTGACLARPHKAAKQPE